MIKLRERLYIRKHFREGKSDYLKEPMGKYMSENGEHFFWDFCSIGITEVLETEGIDHGSKHLL